MSPHWPKSGGSKKNFLLAPLAGFVPHFQNRGAAPGVMQWNSMYVLPESESNCIYIHSPIRRDQQSGIKTCKLATVLRNIIYDPKC